MVTESKTEGRDRTQQYICNQEGVEILIMDASQPSSFFCITDKKQGQNGFCNRQSSQVQFILTYDCHFPYQPYVKICVFWISKSWHVKFV